MAPLDDDSPEARAIRRHGAAQRVRGLAEAAAWFLLFCGTIALTCGWLGRFHWFLELFSHFVPQVAAALALSVTLALLSRYWVALLPGVVLLGACVWMLWPFVGPLPPTTPADVGVRLLFANVLTENTRKGDLVKLVEDTRPDLVALVEVDRAWAEALTPLHDAYPHREISARSDNFGVALYSKLPFRTVDVISYADVDLPSIVATVEVDRKIVTIIVTHPPPPLGADMTRMHHTQLAGFASDWAGRAERLVIVGDLNAAPWSPAFRAFVRRVGLVDGRRGRGLQPTWPTGFYPLRIPIDHVLVGPGLVIRKHEVARDIGSDHFPLFAEIGVSR